MRLFYIVSLCVIIASCGAGKATVDDSSSTTNSTEEVVKETEKKITGAHINIDGTVKDMSAGQEGGGCNFVIEVEIDGKKMVLDPDSLPTKYQKDGAKVVISFDYSRRVSNCPEAMPVILSEIEDQ